MFMRTIFLLNIMGTLGRIPNGQLVPLLKAIRFLISSRSDGKPNSSQAIEERILIDTPSSMMVPAMTILYACTMIQNGTLAGKRGLPSRFESKETTRLLGGGTE